MLRPFVVYCLSLWLVIILTLISAIQLGQQQHSEIIAYIVRPDYPHPSQVNLFDVSRQLVVTLWTSEENNVFDIVPNVDGSLLFYVCGQDDCSFLLWDGDTTHEIVQGLSAQFGSETRWSANGMLAFTQCTIEGCDLSVWNDGAINTLTNSPTLQGSWAMWSADNRLAFAACANVDCNVMLWDGQTLEAITENSGKRILNIPSWSVDGQFVYNICDENFICDVMVWDGNTTINLSANSSLTDTYPAWSNDGRLAFALCDTIGLLGICDIIVWDGNTLQNITNTVGISETYPVWSNNGSLAFVQMNEQDQQIMIWDGETTQLVSQQTNGSLVVRGWGPEEQLVFSSCHINMCDLTLWDGTLHPLSQQFTLFGNNLLQWNSNGELLFTICNNNACDVMLWDGQTLSTPVDMPFLNETSGTWLP
jgi:Tol biopolymer transport system component